MRSIPRHAVIIMGLMLLPGSVYGENTSYHDEQGKHHVVPEHGFVPDAETAIRIAEAVWLPIYGDKLKNEYPFHAKLVGDVWHVQGHLPEGMLGGVAEAEIRQSDGAILRVSHGQ